MKGTKRVKAAPRHAGRRAHRSSTPTPFASWRAAMGFNGKQVAEAGARVGLSNQAAGHRNRGTTEMGELELLGLTAAYLGLPAWTPDLPDRLDDRARTMVGLVRDDIVRCLSQDIPKRRTGRRA